MLTKRLNARKWAASGLSDEEELKDSETRGITKKVVIAVLTRIQSSCLHGEHPEATTMLLHAVAKRIKRLASPKNKLRVGFALESCSLKKVPPLLLTTDFRTKASKTVLLVLLEHVKCPLVDYTIKKPSQFTAEKMEQTRKCAVLPYIVTADSLTAGMVDTVLDIFIAMSEVSEPNITSSAVNMFGKVQHKVKQFVVFHKETGLYVTKGSKCGGMWIHLNEVSSFGSSPEQFWSIAKDITPMPTPADSLVVVKSSTKLQTMLPEEVRGMSCITSSTEKTKPKTSTKDLKLKISAVESQRQKQLSEKNCTSQVLDKQDTGQIKRVSLRVRPSSKKPLKDFHLTATGSKSTATSSKQTSNENAFPTETYCDKMVGDHSNTVPQTKCIKQVQTLRIREAILKEYSHSIVKNLVSDVMESVLLKMDIALLCPCASTVEATPASIRIAESKTKVGRADFTAWPASPRKEAWVSQTPLAIAETKETDKMGQAVARLEYLISSGEVEKFAIDLTNQLCHLLKQNTCQRCSLQAGRSFSDTDLPSLQRQNYETADSSVSLKNTYKFVERSVKHLLHQVLYPSHPVKAGDPEDFILGIPGFPPCKATEAHESSFGDPFSSSHTLDEIVDLVRERVMTELMRVLAQIATTHAQTLCPSKGSHFGDVATKSEVAGTEFMSSNEAELPMPCKGKSSKVAAHTKSSTEVIVGTNANSYTGKERKKGKKNKKQNTQLNVSQRTSKKVICLSTYSLYISFLSKICSSYVTPCKTALSLVHMSIVHC